MARTLGLAYYVLGRYEDGDAYMRRRAREVPQEEVLTVAAYESTRALLLVRLGQVDAAVTYADRCLDRWSNSKVLTASNPQYLAGMLEAYMAASRAALSEGREMEPWMKKCERVLNYHRQWSKGHPVGLAQDLLWRAKVYELRGERELAIVTARECIETAAAAKLTYYEALGMVELARWSYQRPPFDKTLLDRAFALTERVGAKGELSRLPDLGAARNHGDP
jgi:tetratricopeptide (TPR) repeat protein